MPLATITTYDPLAWEKRIPRGCVLDRDETILALSRGKTVCHLGAADAPFHDDKAARGELLHQKVRAAAARVLGVDHDAEAVEVLRKKHGIDDILVMDATQRPVGLGRRFDVVLCCDIIEHVTDAGLMLDACKTFMGPETLLVVTTINASAAKAAARAMFGREAVHFDHTCYYSYSTLCQLMLKKNLRPVQVGTFCYPTVTRLAKFFFGTLARWAPGTADGVLVTARLQAK